MKYKTLYIVTIILMFLHENALAQFSKFELKQISKEHGLPGVTIRQLFQDSKGIIWTSVESVGLCKYDGYDFRLYEHNPLDSTSLTNNIIEAIAEDNESNIWAGTPNGLSVYLRKQNRFKTFRTQKNSTQYLPSKIINALMRDSRSNMWVATGTGISLFDHSSETFRHFQTDSSAPLAFYNICQTKDKTIWLASDNGLYTADENFNIKKKHIYLPNGQEFEGLIFRLEATNDNSLLLSHYMELYQLPKGDSILKPIKIIDRLDKGAHNRITSILQDSKGNVWTSTTIYGICIINLESGQYINYKPDNCKADGIKNAASTDIIEDSQGLIWIGQKFEGIQIFNYQNETIKHIEEEGHGTDKLSSKSLISLEYTANGLLLIETSDGGVNIYKPENGSIIQDILPQINAKKITDIEQTSLNNTYIGTHQGLFFSDVSLQKATLLDLKLYVNDLEIGSDNEVWAATAKGVYLIKNKTVTPLDEICPNQTDVQNININCLHYSSDSSLWIGSYNNGLYLYNFGKQTIKHFDEKNGTNSLSGNLLRYIHEDADKNIWIATKGDGINKFAIKDSTFTHYSTSDGLSSNTIYNILEDSLHNLWLGGSRGICKFNYKTLLVENYTKEYGLQNDIFESNAVALGHDGMMYFGGDNGFNIVNPYQISLRQKSVPLVFSSIKLFDKQILTDIDTVTELHLSHRENHISFDFSILDYSTNLGKKYTFMLEGLDKAYHTNVNRHFISYTNLKPGDYVFHVKAETKDGFVNNNNIRIILHIDKPFWQETWFYILFVLSSIAIIYLFTSLKLRQSKRQNILLEKTVNEKTNHLIQKQEELIKQKSELENKTAQLEEKTMELEISNSKLESANHTKNTLVSVIAHDLKNQFNPIIGFSHSLMRRGKNNDDNKIVEQSRQIHESANLVYLSLENLLNWYKGQKNELVPQFSKIDLYKILINIKNAYELALNQKSISFLIDSPTDIPIYADVEMVKAVFRNIINNAVKFSNEKGTIKIITEIEKDFATISISDNGKGMNQEQLSLIFDFNKRNALKKIDGSGLGIQICKNFVDAMGGDISVKSGVNEGTTFIIKLPLSN